MGNGNARISSDSTPCSTEYTLYILVNQSSQKVLVAQHNPLPCEDCRVFREVKNPDCFGNPVFQFLYLPNPVLLVRQVPLSGPVGLYHTI